MNYQDNDLAVGQVWEYQNRAGEENSRVIILKIECYYEDKVIVHIAVNNLHLKNSNIEKGFMHEAGHLPYDKASLMNSLTTLERSHSELPNFMEGYGHWKTAFDEGQAGVFTIPLSETFEFLEQSMNA